MLEPCVGTGSPESQARDPESWDLEADSLSTICAMSLFPYKSPPKKASCPEEQAPQMTGSSRLHRKPMPVSSCSIRKFLAHTHLHGNPLTLHTHTRTHTLSPSCINTCAHEAVLTQMNSHHTRAHAHTSPPNAVLLRVCTQIRSPCGPRSAYPRLIGAA